MESIHDNTLKLDVEIKMELWSKDMINKSKHFSKFERETLTNPMMNEILILLGELKRGRYIKQVRLEAWKNAQLAYFKLDSLLLLMYECRYINEGFYYHMEYGLLEIGKMITGLFSSLKK